VEHPHPAWIPATFAAALVRWVCQGQGRPDTATHVIGCRVIL